MEHYSDSVQILLIICFQFHAIPIIPAALKGFNPNSERLLVAILTNFILVFYSSIIVTPYTRTIDDFFPGHIEKCFY